MTAPKLTGNRCQCTACGEYFNGMQPFDKHRIGPFDDTRRCLTVPEMTARGWTRNAAGFWCERANSLAKPCAHGFVASRGTPAIVTQGAEHARA